MDALEGTKVSFVCNAGYTFPDGSTQASTKCLSDGRWTVLPPDCQGTVTTYLPYRQEVRLASFY